MADQVSSHSGDTNDPFRLYASPVGARFLQRANKIFEDFPTSKYILFAAVFTIEVIIVFWLGVYLIP
jgi:hypothetical protein